MSRLAQVQQAAAKPYRKFDELELKEIALKPSEVERDPNYQIRGKFRLDKQQEYAELWSNGVDLSARDPLVIFFIDEECRYVAIDCWHRLAGWQQVNGDKPLTFMYASGSARDAKVAAMGANPAHGLPRTNEDKRRAVEAALADEEIAKLSNIQIADLCAVSDNFVGKIRREVGAEVVERVTKDGRVMNTKDLGAKKRPPTEAPAPKLKIEPAKAPSKPFAEEAPQTAKANATTKPEVTQTYVAPVAPVAIDQIDGFTTLAGGGLTYEGGDASSYFLPDGVGSVEVSIADADGGNATVSLHSLLAFAHAYRLANGA